MDDLVGYRLTSAKDKLTSAKILLEAGQYKDSIGRSYYAIFSAIRAVLAIENIDFSKHAFQIRNSCDYDDFFIVSKQDAEEQYERATEIIVVIEEYIKKVNSYK